MNRAQATRVQTLIDTLRSDKYSQTIGRLRREDSFCCLGVACDLTKDLGYYWLSNGRFSDGIISQENVLPHNVIDLYGFTNHEGLKLNDIFDRYDHYTTLARLNDDGFTFHQIADILQYWLNVQTITD